MCVRALVCVCLRVHSCRAEKFPGSCLIGVLVLHDVSKTSVSVADCDSKEWLLYACFLLLSLWDKKKSNSSKGTGLDF